MPNNLRYLMFDIESVAGAIAQWPCLLAEEDAVIEESAFSYFIRCAGLFGLLMLLAGVAVFVGALLVVFRARRRETLLSYRVYLLSPMLIGIVGAACACIFGARVPGLKPNQYVAIVFQKASDSVFSALLVTLPAVLVLFIGDFVRTRRALKRMAARAAKRDAPPGNGPSAAETGKP